MKRNCTLRDCKQRWCRYYSNFESWKRQRGRRLASVWLGLPAQVKPGRNEKLVVSIIDSCDCKFARASGGVHSGGWLDAFGPSCHRSATQAHTAGRLTQPSAVGVTDLTQRRGSGTAAVISRRQRIHLYSRDLSSPPARTDQGANFAQLPGLDGRVRF